MSSIVKIRSGSSLRFAQLDSTDIPSTNLAIISAGPMIAEVPESITALKPEVSIL